MLLQQLLVRPSALMPGSLQRQCEIYRGRAMAGRRRRHAECVPPAMGLAIRRGKPVQDSGCPQI